MLVNPETPLSAPASSFLRWIPLVAAALFAVALYALVPFITAYGGVRSIFSGMRILWGYEEWQHCWLVPAACAFIIWTKRKTLSSMEMQGTWLGLPVTMAAFLSFWLSFRLDDIYFGFISIQLMTAGLILLFLGFGWMKELFFPWLFLVFAWPLFFLDNLIALPLRMIMSSASVHALNLIGIATVQNGTAILSAPDILTNTPRGARFSVDVADPCSGIRSLFALMMVSALYGYFTFKDWWKRLILFLCSAPLAITGNLFRILALTLGTIAMGPEVAIGSLEHPSFFHMFAGYLVFAVALGGMVLIGYFLQKDWIKVFQNLKNRPSSSGRSSSLPQSSSPSRDVY